MGFLGVFSSGSTRVSGLRFAQHLMVLGKKQAVCKPLDHVVFRVVLRVVVWAIYMVPYLLSRALKYGRLGCIGYI